MKRKCLLIGGCGFIGSHLVRKLEMSDRVITVLDHNNPSDQDKVPTATYISGDFSDTNIITQLVPEHDEVVHLAYATRPNTSFDDPLADLELNLSPAVQLFEIAASCGVKLLLVSSGGTVYGEAINLPIREDHPTKPISPYGITKLTLENYAYLYAVTHGLKYVCVRPSNAYGVGQSPFVGQGFIATAMASAMTGKPIHIFGQFGTIRDYLYVEDIASGIFSAMEHGFLSRTYNLGSGTGLSNLDVIEAFQPLLHEIGCEVRVERLPERVFDVKANVLDSTSLQKDTGWRPETGFDEGLILTRDWLKGQLQ